MTCRQFIVSGRVQGVFFRGSTRDLAVRLGITGHAINLPDGNVEVLACGPDDAVQKLAVWLQDGPQFASVSNVEDIAIECAKPTGFSTG